MQNEDVKALSDRRKRALTPRITAREPVRMLAGTQATTRYAGV